MCCFLLVYKNIILVLNYQLVILSVKELRQIIREEIRAANSFSGTEINIISDEIVFTSIRQIAEYFHCSLPTAQKIKNSIPKDQYSQTGRTFAIPESVLKQANPQHK